MKDCSSLQGLHWALRELSDAIKSKAGAQNVNKYVSNSRLCRKRWSSVMVNWYYPVRSCLDGLLLDALSSTLRHSLLPVSVRGILKLVSRDCRTPLQACKLQPLHVTWPTHKQKLGNGLEGNFPGLL